MARGLLHPLVLLVGWGGGGEQNTLLDNRCLNMRDWLRTSSVLLTSHHNYSKQRRKKSDKKRWLFCHHCIADKAFYCTTNPIKNTLTMGCGKIISLDRSYLVQRVQKISNVFFLELTTWPIWKHIHLLDILVSFPDKFVNNLKHKHCHCFLVMHHFIRDNNMRILYIIYTCSFFGPNSQSKECFLFLVPMSWLGFILILSGVILCKIYLDDSLAPSLASLSPKKLDCCLLIKTCFRNGGSWPWSGSIASPVVPSLLIFFIIFTTFMFFEPFLLAVGDTTSLRFHSYHVAGPSKAFPSVMTLSQFGHLPHFPNMPAWESELHTKLSTKSPN